MKINFWCRRDECTHEITKLNKRNPTLKVKLASTLTSFNRADPSAGNCWSMLTQRSSSPPKNQAGLAQQTQLFGVLVPSMMPDTGTHSMTHDTLN